MTHTLPKLPYAFNALEPHLDAATMELHYSKHHQTYVDKLNAALEGQSALQHQPVDYLLTHLDQIPESIRPAVINHGGGHHNHSLLWPSLAPQSSSAPSGQLLQALTQTFGSFEQFKQQLTVSALSHFGSGWAWLAADSGHQLKIYSLPNQDSPLSRGDTPLLGIDVWEHAYYLKFQNRRPEYVDAFFNVINWPEINRRLQTADK